MTETTGYQFILDLLNAENHIIARKQLLLGELDKNFSSLRDASAKIVEELIWLTENDPGVIISITQSFLNSKDNLSKFIDSSFNEKIQPDIYKDSIPGKMNFLSSSYELAGLFAFTSYLVSNRKLKLSKSNSPQSILSHFKSVGLTSTDIEDIRTIRNASSHKHSVHEEYIVFENKKIAMSRVHELHLKLTTLMSWNLTLIFYSLFLVPKFGILAGVTIYNHAKRNSIDWIKYANGLSVFYKEGIEFVNRENEQKQNEKKIGKADIQPAGSIYENAVLFIINNLPVITERWHYHLNTASGLIYELRSGIDNCDEKITLQQLEHWILSGTDLFDKILKEYLSNPEKFVKFLKQPDNGASGSNLAGS